MDPWHQDQNNFKGQWVTYSKIQSTHLNFWQLSGGHLWASHGDHNGAPKQTWSLSWSLQSREWDGHNQSITTLNANMQINTTAVIDQPSLVLWEHIVNLLFYARGLGDVVLDWEKDELTGGGVKGFQVERLSKDLVAGGSLECVRNGRQISEDWVPETEEQC